jgi:hypothetical protein
MGVVVFDPAAFVQQYPAFAAYNTAHPTGLQGYFNTAALYLSNKDSSRVADVATRATLLNLLVAHLAQLDGVTTPAGQGSQSQMVGRVSSATEGSVTVQTQMAAPGSAAWYMQTQYGATYWQATARYRSMRYVGGGC